MAGQGGKEGCDLRGFTGVGKALRRGCPPRTRREARAGGGRGGRPRPGAAGASGQREPPSSAPGPGKAAGGSAGLPAARKAGEKKEDRVPILPLHLLFRHRKNTG